MNYASFTFLLLYPHLRIFLTFQIMFFQKLFDYQILKIFWHNDPTVPLLRIYLSEMKAHGHVKACPWMFITALLIIAKCGNNSNVQQLIDKQNVLYLCGNGMLCGNKKKWVRYWYIYIYYDMDEPWRHSGRGKKPVTTTTCCMIPFICNVQNRQIYGDRKQKGGGR